MNWQRTSLGLSLSFLLALSACSSDGREKASSPQVVRNVAVVSARRASVPDYLEVAGTVRSVQTSTIASQMMGNILEIRAREGDRVARGEVLAVIDDAQPRAALERAQAAQLAAQQEMTAANSDFRLAEATFKRYQDLYDKKSVSPQEFDEAKARFQGSQARLDMSRAGLTQVQAGLAQARTSQEYSRVRAPFDGVITEKKIDPGTLASPGMPLFTIEDPHRYRLEASLDESALGQLRMGQAISVRMDVLEADLQGKVTEIVPAADPSTRSFLAKIELPVNPRLRSGLFGRARIPRGQKNVVLIPSSAVVGRGQLQGVYVLDNAQVASLRYVTLGNNAGGQIEVLSGLDGNEQLVAAPGDQELGGRKVEVQP